MDINIPFLYKVISHSCRKAAPHGVFQRIYPFYHAESDTVSLLKTACRTCLQLRFHLLSMVSPNVRLTFLRHSSLGDAFRVFSLRFLNLKLLITFENNLQLVLGSLWSFLLRCLTLAKKNESLGGMTDGRVHVHSLLAAALCSHRVACSPVERTDVLASMPWIYSSMMNSSTPPS